MSFTDVPNLHTPAPITQTVVAGQVTTVQGIFGYDGWLRVITDPAVAGTIFVDGVPRNDWQMWQSMPAGTYTVTFGDVEGYITPGPQTAVVTEGATTVITGSYVAGPLAASVATAVPSALAPSAPAPVVQPNAPATSSPLGNPVDLSTMTAPSLATEIRSAPMTRRPMDA